MNYSESYKKLLETLEKKLADAELADDFMSKIDLIGSKYSLILGEMGEIYEIVDNIINKRITEDKLLDSSLEKLGVTEEEIEEVAVWLEEILGQIKEAEIISTELKLLEKELEKREK